MLREKLVYLNSICNDFKKISDIFNKDPNLDKVDLKKANEYIKNLNCNYITIFDNEYPNKLKVLSNPPWVLYYYGDINLLNQFHVAIVGTRTPTKYGMRATADIIKDIKNDSVIISGFSYGISRQAHISAIMNNMKTVAIAGCGLDSLNLLDNKLESIIKKEHLFISEFSPELKAAKITYPKRNRLIAALCDKLLVMEAREDSSVLKMIDQVIDLNKNVYALPGNVYEINSVGTNQLIQDGASVLYLGVDI